MDATLEKSKSGRSWAPLIIGAALMIVAAQLFPLLGIKVSGLAENRTLARRPDLPRSLADWKVLADRWDAYLTDNFPPRAYMISRLNYARYLLGYSGASKIVVGKDGWLFYDDGAHLSHFAGVSTLSEAEVKSWAEGFRQRVDYLHGMGIQFYMIIGPEGQGMYPEHVPSWMPNPPATTEVDEISNLMAQTGDGRFVDPRPALSAEKARLPLYDEFDTHWTGYGSYIGYRALMTRISKDLPDLQPYPESHFDSIAHVGETGNMGMAEMLGIGDFVHRERLSYADSNWQSHVKTTYLARKRDWTAPHIIDTQSKSGKTLLLMRDSFATELIPLLSANFSRIIIVHVQDGFFRDDLIKQYHPDVVVLEVIEGGARYTMDPLPIILAKYQH
jgi:alginate O-acetyltransferase complex protein AlgJ